MGQCRNCLDIIESKHVHDFVTCSCWKEELKKHGEDLTYMPKHGIALDGGREYKRVLFVNYDEFISLPIPKDAKLTLNIPKDDLKSISKSIIERFKGALQKLSTR